MHAEISTRSCRRPIAVFLVALASLGATELAAQPGRVFRSTPETIGIWEFNDLPVAVGVGLPDGSVIPDLSGNGLDATVRGNANGAVAATAGDDLFENNTACGRVAAGGSARVEIDDPAPFEMAADEDFSVELYVRREGNQGENWGLLAGTWHSRTVIDDGLEPIANGAWYGYGFIANPDTGGWHFTTSPINPDGTFPPSYNEVYTQPAFVIPEGPHYVVATVDRTLNVARAWLDGDQVGEIFLPAGQPLITPTGYEPAPFVFLTGIDDLSRGAFRQSPNGYSIDAARVQRRVLTSEEIFENYLLISDGEAVPFCDDDCPTQAIASASSANVLVDECVRLSGANSSTADDRTITSYEWRIGAGGEFVAGDVTREVSFDAPGAVVVSLRVTDSGGGIAQGSVTINVRHPAPVAVISARAGDEPLGGTRVWVAAGDTVHLDGGGSSTPIPPAAVVCPIASGVPVPEPPIVEFRWDLDGNGSTDSSDEIVDLEIPAAGTRTVALTVRNEAGAEHRSTLTVVAVATPGGFEPAPEGRIFLPTPDTVAIWEMNELDTLDETLPNTTEIPDLSGNDLHATVEANDGGELTYQPGDAHFGENNSVGKAFGGIGRVVVNDDGGAFEMGADQSFSIELYVRRAEQTGNENWGMLAGTWHTRSLVEDALDPITEGAWYGYGFVRDVENGGWVFNCSPINPDGSFVPSYNELKTPIFTIPAGSHYVVATVDRTLGRATVYVDGQSRGSVNLPAGQAFITPAGGYDHARFAFFSREDDTTLGTYTPAPTGYGVDAARVMKRALSLQEIRTNHDLIRAGIAVPPTEVAVEICDSGADDDGDGLVDCDDPDCAEFAACLLARFVRGDADGSGGINLTDGVNILLWSFQGGVEPACLDAADTDDTGSINLSDPIRIFQWLFLGGVAPVDPMPSGAAYVIGDCGSDPTGDDPFDCGTPGPVCAPAL